MRLLVSITRCRCGGAVFRAFLLSALVTANWDGSANAQSNASTSTRKPVATVAGMTIYEDELPGQAIAELREVREREYEVIVNAVQDLVSQRLLTEQARKRAVTTDKFLTDEVDSKTGNPSPAEVEAFYLAQRDRSQALEDVKDSLVRDLKQARIQAGREALLRSLRQHSDLAILLERPRVSVAFDRARVEGNPSAAVNIVEFSDFDCPFCRQAQSTLKSLLDRYQEKVSIAYRDFPLREKHPQAELAAEAARCAGEQGKFWEYHDLLFAETARRDRADLLRFSETLKLEREQFDECLTSGRYKQQIEQDRLDGARIGVSATPAFFINGVLILGAQPVSAFEKIIDEELRSATRKTAQK